MREALLFLSWDNLESCSIIWDDRYMDDLCLMVIGMNRDDKQTREAFPFHFTEK